MPIKTFKISKPSPVAEKSEETQQIVDSESADAPASPSTAPMVPSEATMSAPASPSTTPMVPSEATSKQSHILSNGAHEASSMISDASAYVPTPEEELLLEQLKLLKEKHAEDLKAAKAKARREAFAAKIPTLKISNKGCVQINGIRRFPITLYKNEWEKIFEIIPDIKTFIEVNCDALASI